MTRSSSNGTARTHLRKTHSAKISGHAVGTRRLCHKTYYKAEVLSNYGMIRL